MNNKYFRILCFVFLTSAVMSCEDYLDINTNPNKPTQVSVQLLMAHATLRTGDNIQLAGNITSYYVQYLASPNLNGSKDIHDPQPYDGTWESLYKMMSDLSDLEKLAVEEQVSQYIGAAKILKAINLGLTVDLWGDVPYSQAFFAEYLKPEYDTDEELYTEIFTLLDEGIAEISKPDQTVTLGDDDFIYGGEVASWVKMANSLKARYLLHLSGTDQFNATDIYTALSSGIQTNGENGDVAYSTQGPDVYNPWAKVARSQEALILDGWISEQLADAMNGTTFGVVDPRLPYMFGDNEDGEYVGVENGAGRGTEAGVSGDRSTLERGTYYASDDSPILIITLAEAKFIEAETAFRSSDLTRAYEAYLDGIEAHMDMLGVDPTEANAYVTNPAVAVGAGNITLALIMKEKYVALFLHPETWNDARRFNYAYEDMTLPANHNPELNGQFVRRLVYPDSEVSRNLDNVPPVTILDRIWWDQE
jgi:hypothetical protein